MPEVDEVGVELGRNSQEEEEVGWGDEADFGCVGCYLECGLSLGLLLCEIVLDAHVGQGLLELVPQELLPISADFMLTSWHSLSYS